jgi:hypothetical protein
MGTRADYYAGTDPATMIYIGSTPMDGDPASVADWGLATTYATHEAFETGVLDAILPHRGQTAPEGWPWPWNDSRTTDYAYCWDADTHDVMVSCFGSPLLALADILLGVAPAFDSEAEKIPFPDQSHIKAIRWNAGYAPMIIQVPR